MIAFSGKLDYNADIVWKREYASKSSVEAVYYFPYVLFKTTTDQKRDLLLFFM